MKTEVLNVTGMTCGGCTATVTQALTALPGVSKVDVSLEKKTAEVTFNETTTSLDRMGDAVRFAGYGLATTPETPAPHVASACCS